MRPDRGDLQRVRYVTVTGVPGGTITSDGSVARCARRRHYGFLRELLTADIGEPIPSDTSHGMEGIY